MAKIDAGKLLPQSNKSSFLAKTGKVNFSVPKYTKVADRNLKNEKPVQEEEDTEEIIFKKKHENEVKRIEGLVDNISTLLMSRKVFEEKRSRKAKGEEQSKKRRDAESLLESKKKDDDKIDAKEKIRKLTGVNIIDAIWKFFLFTITGVILNKTKDILPGLAKVAGYVVGVSFKVFETIIGALFEGFVFFVDVGFKIHDTLRGSVKFLTGDTGVKIFDAFTSGLSTFLNTALIVGMTLASMGMMPDFGLGGGGGKGQRGAAPGSTPGRRPPAPGARPGRPPAPGARPGGPAARPGAQPLRGMPKPPRPGAPQGFPGAGRAAGKGVSKVGSKFVPFIGPLIDFAIRTLVFGDSPGRAAAGAAGVAAGQALGGILGGAIGTLAGSVVPIIGNLLAGGAGALIGSVIGGFVGDAIGTTLYDMIFERSKTTKPKGRASGGRVSRPVRPVATRPRRLRIKKPSNVKRKTEPGKDIGGKSVIQRLFPDTESSDGSGEERGGGLVAWAKRMLGLTKEGKKRPKRRANPYKALTKTSETLKKVPVVGGIMGASIDIALGQKPNDIVYNHLGESLAALIQASANKASAEAITKTISAFAVGGIVSPASASTFEDDSDRLATSLSKSFKRAIDVESTIAIRDIMTESGKYRDGSQRDGSGGGDKGEGDSKPGAPGGWPDQPGGAPGAPGKPEPAGGGMGGRRGTRGAKAKPGTPKVPGVPGVTPPSPAAGGGSGNIAVQLTANQRKALDILSKYESAGSGGYNAVNQIGIAGGRGVKGYSGDFSKMSQHGGRKLTDLTVGEVMALQAPSSMSDAEWIKRGRLHAVGRYQFIGTTLAAQVERAGIPKDAKFTKEVQDLLAVQYMKDAGIKAWIGPADHATEAERQIIEAARRDPVKFTRATAPKGGGGAAKAGAATSAGGFDTGLRTGPSGRIGAGTEYHVDARFKSHLPLDQKIAMMDSMARAHAQSGYTMEFSGIGVSGKRWDPNMPREQKEAFAKQVLASHHSPRAGYQPFDYYVVKQSAKNRFDRSAEGSSIMAPVIPGGSYQIDEQPGGAGRFITFFDKEGNEVGKIMHGDTGIASPIQMGKRFNMPEIPPDQIAGDRKPGQEATLNGKPVVWDGKNWKPKSQNLLSKIAESLVPKAAAAEKAPAAKPATKPTAPGGPSSPARTQAARAAARPKPAAKPAAPAAPKRAWYDPRGWVGKQDGGQINPVGRPPRKDFAPLQSHASYEKTGQSLMIQPVLVTKYVPIMDSSTTSFGGGSTGGVNSSGTKRNSLSRH